MANFGKSKRSSSVDRRHVAQKRQQSCPEQNLRSWQGTHKKKSKAGPVIAAAGAVYGGFVLYGVFSDNVIHGYIVKDANECQELLPRFQRECQQAEQYAKEQTWLASPRYFNEQDCKAVHSADGICVKDEEHIPNSANSRRCFYPQMSGYFFAYNMDGQLDPYDIPFYSQPVFETEGKYFTAFGTYYGKVRRTLIPINLEGKEREYFEQDSESGSLYASFDDDDDDLKFKRKRTARRWDHLASTAFKSSVRQHAQTSSSGGGFKSGFSDSSRSKGGFGSSSRSGFFSGG